MSQSAYLPPGTCPRDGHTLEFVSGTYGTGVYAPDGYQESQYQEGLYCPKCETVFEDGDIEPEPVRCDHCGISWCEPDESLTCSDCQKLIDLDRAEANYWKGLAVIVRPNE